MLSLILIFRFFSPSFNDLVVNCDIKANSDPDVNDDNDLNIDSDLHVKSDLSDVILILMFIVSLKLIILMLSQILT